MLLLYFVKWYNTFDSIVEHTSRENRGRPRSILVASRFVCMAFDLTVCVCVRALD